MNRLQKVLLFIVLITIIRSEYTCKLKFEGPYVNKTLEGCFQDCQGFPTLEAAQVACAKEPDCQGITFSSEKSGSKTYGYYDGQYSFQLRSGSKVFDTDKNEISFLKTDSKQCKQCWQFYSGPFMDRFLMGCDKSCRDYESQYDAEEYCTNSATCKGFTWSTPSLGGGNSNGPAYGWGYQLRSSQDMKIKENSGQFSFLKTNTYCDTEYLYDFEGPYNLQQLSGCTQDCKDFPTFEEAQIACMKDKECGGITFAHKDQGGSASKGFYNGNGYQLRKGSEPEVTINLQVSWVKQEKDTQNCQIRYNGPLPKHSLTECFDDCQDFPTLQTALDECNKFKDCGGVTYSAKGNQGAAKAIGARDGTYGYQLRKSQYAVPTENNEFSYVKTELKQCQKCWYQFYGQFDKTLPECDKDCQDFAVQQDAQKACSQSKTCGGITWAQAKEKAKGPVDGWGFQLRKAGDMVDNQGNGEFTFLKGNKLCERLTTPFTGPYNQEQLAQCAQNCKTFSSLTEAELACSEDNQCGGITWSGKNQGDNNGLFEGQGFQLRSGKDLVPGGKTEQTWVKNICARLFSECNYKGKSVIICAGDAYQNIPEFTVRSIRVPDDFHIILYNKQDLDGDHIVISKDKECMVGDYFMN